MALTAEQQMAVSLRNRTVLVSAAAGAGKTRVLTERLMGYVNDPDRPRHIDEFLVVTYTRAAAGELRSRIFSRLRELSEEAPDNEHLREQMKRVYTARIGTLDAYCREIILENAAEAGLPSGFRTGDAAEMELLRARVLEETLDTLYEQAYSEDPASLSTAGPDGHGGSKLPFRLCADTYGDERGDRALGDLILHIWQQTRCHADPMGWLREKTASFPGADWQGILFEQALCVTEAFLRDYRQMVPAVRGGALRDTYGVTLLQDLAGIERLEEVLRRKNWDEISQFTESCTFEKLKALKTGDAEPPPEAGAFKILREGWKKAFERLRPLFFGTLESHLRDVSALSPLLEGLYEAVRAFDEALTAEKLRLAVLEFSDIERMALKLLADNPSARFTEILVDEVQDINPLQDAIISALSRDGGSVFYVGDTRQSIYRFQMAEPGIFRKKLEDAPCRVFLTKNFRSAKPILDAVNHIFSRIECPETGLLREDEFLISGKDGGDGAPVELLTGSGDEAERVARRLRKLVESGEAGADECVILMRSPKNRLPEYRAALEREGLTCAAPPGEGYFDRPEILTMLSALEVIDNARLDVPLVSVLRSPITACTPDELAALRSLADGPLCGCLPLSRDEKVITFYSMFQTWRELASDLPPYVLAARVTADSGFLEKAGSAARENLLLLPEVLRGYGGELRGLPDWLRKQDVSAVPASGRNVSGEGGGVRILSIHGAKGLEFPVVVVAGLSKKLNLQDQYARLLAHPRLGLGVKRRDEFSEYPTPSYRAVQAAKDSETRAEELRLLYVAMTRAEKRLILSCGAPLEGEALPMLTKGDLILNPTVASWLLKVRDPRWKRSDPEPASPAVPPGPEPSERPARPPEPDWRYPYPDAVDTPSKMTATGLKGRYPDEQVHEDAAEYAPFPGERRSPLARPAFLDGGAGEREYASPTGRGTAIHLFLQFADFEKCAASGGVEAETERLRANMLLSDGQAGAVDADALRAFFQTPRAKALIAAQDLRREQKFSLLVGNGDVPGLTLPEGEKVLLQGVIDCFYETPEGVVLLDFKTDRVGRGGEWIRAERYKPQMEAYAAALAAMTGRVVAERVLIFLATGAEVSI
ncbi:MAG: UvrD-helicase domain-containing protein [Oscillospiraceae bacterium]|jgi:ATP-dependent helicase/nuclease subunit A|nr:UvrD-helicase domain-containing protein [Oscillospiraceae bacterium]